MSKFEDKIREALMEDENETIRNMAEEQGVFTMMLDTFRGRNGWLMVVQAIATVVIFAIGIYALVKFMDTTDPRESSLYGMIIMLAMVAVAVMKIMGWMEMTKNSIVREILRVELRVIELSKKLDQLAK